MTLKTNGQLGRVSTMLLDHPARLALDFTGVAPGNLAKTIPSQTPGITAVRVGTYRGRTRVVLDSDRTSFQAYHLIPEAEGLRISFFLAAAQGEKPEKPAHTAETPESAAVKHETATGRPEVAVRTPKPSVQLAKPKGGTGRSPESAADALAREARVSEICPDKAVPREEVPGALLEDIVRFRIARYDITTNYAKVVQQVAKVMKDDPYTTAFIEGHADSTGTPAGNMVLSRKRALEVKKRLVQRYGIDPSRISIAPYGCTLPVADNTSVEGRRLNRRVVIILLGTE